MDRHSTLIDPIHVPGTNLLSIFAPHGAPARCWTTPVIDGSHRLFTDAEVLVEPVAAARRCGNEPACDVLLLQDLVSFAVLPRARTSLDRPVERVALTLQTDNDGTRLMVVCLRIAPARVLGDESASSGGGRIPMKIRLNTAVAWCTLIIERQLAVHNIREDVAAHR